MVKISRLLGASTYSTQTKIIAESIKPDYNVRQLCTAMRAKAKRSRYVGNLFTGAVEDIEFDSSQHRTRLIHIVRGGEYGTTVKPASDFTNSKPCRHVLSKYRD